MKIKIDTVKQATDKVDTQISTELYYSKKAVNKRIEGIIERDVEIQECLSKAIEDITEWATNFDKYDSKIKRLNILLEKNDITKIVTNALIVVMRLVDRRDLLSAISGQVSGMIKGMDTLDAVKTASEIIVLMCDADLIDLTKDENTYSLDGEIKTTMSWYVSNPWELNEATINHIDRAMYLPPMIVKPRKLSSVNHGGYLTLEKQSVFTGKAKKYKRDGYIAIEALNKYNGVALSLNLEMISKLTNELVNDKEAMEKINSNPKRREQYDIFMNQSAEVYAYLVKNGNEFFLDHKYDERMRVYSSGYHANTQGDSFRKSIVDLANKEEVKGEW